MINYPVECPLMNKKIEENTCFDIHMVVSGEAPKYTAPEEIFNVLNYQSVCKNCKYHRND
jgi:hypothetical protein